jgi:hypothetical protein
VADRSLVGDGDGASADGRLVAVRNTLEEAGDLIDAGLIDEACGQLRQVELQADGEPQPPDFVAGAAAAELLASVPPLAALVFFAILTRILPDRTEFTPGQDFQDPADETVVRDSPFELGDCGDSKGAIVMHAEDLDAGP